MLAPGKPRPRHVTLSVEVNAVRARAATPSLCNDRRHAMRPQHILLATDGSESSRKAIDYAAELAAHVNAKLLVLHVQRRHGRDRVPPELAELERIEHIRMTEAEVLQGVAETVAAHAEQAAIDKGVAKTERIVAEGDPAREIVATAAARDVDTIVIGSRGLGDLQGLLLGSVSHKVAQAAPCTCIIVR